MNTEIGELPDNINDESLQAPGPWPLFHRCWGRAKQSSIYVKDDWTTLQAAIHALETKAPQAKPAEALNLRQALLSSINRFSAENESCTPDYVLADYLLGCLAAFDQAVITREQHYGRMMARTSES